MGVMLQVAYRRGVGLSVPGPTDDKSAEEWWYDHIAKQLHDMSQAGVTAILLPPVLKSMGGSGKGCDGYGVYDDYDIGSKNDQGGIPTRFGTRNQLLRLTAMARANGIDVYSDQVPHQRMGAPNGTYRYLGADGKTRNGRFPKDPGCFVGPSTQGRVPRDPVAGPVADDFAFGDELAPINAKPHGYVMQGLIDAGDWLFRTLGLQGARIDDTKGQAIEAVNKWINSGAMKGKFFVGEYADGNAYNLHYWVWQQGLYGQVSAFDFALHYILEAMCNETSRWDMRQLDHAGLAGICPAQAVTFVESPDTDTNGFAGIVWNKIMAYAYILTSEGYPCIYYRDYSTDPGCYGLKPQIDNLIWIHENLAFGGTTFRYKDPEFVVYERLGYPNLLVGLNNDQYNTHGAWVQTGFGPHVELHEYSGRGPNIWTNQDGWVYLNIPKNTNGEGFVTYSRVGYANGFQPNNWHARQVIFGSDDLDIGPATPVFKEVGQIYCEAHSKITVDSIPGTNYEVVPDGTDVSLKIQGGECIAPTKGWYKLYVKSNTDTPHDFELHITYMAPRTI